MDDRLGLSITHPAFREKRWGPDEVDARNRPGGLTFGTSIPGGFKDLSHDLIRDPLGDYGDLRLLADVRAFDAGNETVWEGRQVQFARGERSVGPGAVGHAAALKDDESFQMVYVDRDLSRWGGAPRGRQAVLMGANYSQAEAPQVMPDTASGLPVLVLRHQDQWTAPIRPVAEAWFDMGPGLKVGRVHHNAINVGANPADSGWDFRVQTTETDNASSVVADTGDIWPTLGPVSLVDTVGSRYAFITFLYTVTPGGAVSYVYSAHVRNVAVYGNHSVSLRGTEPFGLYVPDVIADIVSRAAPRLTYTRGAGGSIEDDTFIVPHLAYRGGTTGEQAIMDATKYMLDWEWGVYTGKQFFYRRVNPTRTVWEARLSDGAKLTPQGEQADDAFNGVVVIYRDPAGEEHMVGPPGSATEVQFTTLADVSPSNAVNAAGIARRWAQLQISQVTTQAGALRVGELWLSERTGPQFRGELELSGIVRHPTRGCRPAWTPWAGDYVRVAERPTDPPMRIIETRYAHETRSNMLTLDNTLFRTEAILERMGLALVGVL